MKRINLIIKFGDEFLCEKIHNEVDFIHVPNYFDLEAFYNISIFITLLYHGLLDKSHHSKISLLHTEWMELFERGFIPELLYQVDENTYLYDVTKIEEWNNFRKNLPEHFTFITSHEKLVSNHLDNTPNSETTPYGFHNSITFVNPDVLFTIKKTNPPRTEKDVLLMYSGGKDSTLAAIRLAKMGYNVHFIHFDNGYMCDSNKPFLTYQKSFAEYDNYYFPYHFTKVNINEIFESLFSHWSIVHGKNVLPASIDSEIQCLTCRSAMYLQAIAIALENNYKYIAEGARISQKFMIEQPEMLKHYQSLAEDYGIKLLLPVLYLEDDNEEIEELLSSGFSSKSWESKCLLGTSAMNKTLKDEEEILEYYNQFIKPVQKNSIQKLVYKNITDIKNKV